MEIKNLNVKNLNVKKALIAAVVLYALIFLVASAFMIVLTKTNPMFSYATLIVAVVLTFLISQQYYFKGFSVTNPIMDGLMLGVVLVAVTFVLEVPIMVYGFAADQGWSYFSAWHIIVGYGLTLLVPIAAAYTRK